MTGLRSYVMAWCDEDLDSDGPVPLWYQVAERLRLAIEKGEFRPGDLLPSESGINNRFGVSRTTSRAALDSLEQQGLVRRRSGRGSIVLPTRLDQPLDSLTSFAEDMRARGHTPGYRTHRVTRVPAGAEVAEALAIAAGSSVLCIDRTMLADAEPIALSRVILNQRLFGGHRTPKIADLDRGSLYEWLRTMCGISLVSGEEVIEAAVADGVAAEALGVPRRAPLLVVRRTSRDPGGVPVEHVVTQYLASRYRLRISLPRQ